MIDLLIQWATC